MSNTDCITDCGDIEAMLRDYAATECFGAPPRDLVAKAMSRTACRQVAIPRTVVRPLIVMSIAAAALLVATMNRTGGIHDGLSDTAADVAQISSDSTIGIEGERSATPQMPERTSNRQLVAHLPDSQAPNGVGAAPDRADPSDHHTAYWTDTVVTSSEQGIVVPVVADNQGTDQTAEAETGVAVVPVHTTVSYTSYDGENSP
jgi:hypothetical protein